ncbi:MAG: hypothetical protein B7Y02_07455, partial [Rhodobacterales bacterium 17-64-5]
MTDPSRRQCLAYLGGLAALGLLPAHAEEVTGLSFGPPATFSPETVVTRARALAAAPHAPLPAVDEGWLNMNYDAFRGIWFDTRHTLFRGQPGAAQAEFFVAGLYYPPKIAMNAVEGGLSRSILFELRTFDMTDQFPKLAESGTGFSGFRLLGELEVEKRFQEYVVFQGASYFRAIGRGQAYGLSSRGLALNVAEPAGEEFP